MTHPVLYRVDWRVNQGARELEERLGVAGGGAIARGIAAAAAPHGDVLMWVRSETSAQRAAARFDERDLPVRVETDRAVLDSATFVIEAIVEEAEAKSAFLADLHGALGPAVVLASTTSSLSVGELARASGRPDRFVGFHVFNPVERMQLVELAFPPEADARVRQRASALCQALGKVSVEVPDVPGFVVNRLLFPYLFSAVDLVEQTGMDPGDVDRCMQLGAGHPMGPLALLDFVGLDVAVAIGEALGVPVPGGLRELVADGALGRKSGRGLFSYPTR